MRGYKRTESIYNVITLTARMGACSGHYTMTELYYRNSHPVRLLLPSLLTRLTE